MTQPLLRRSVFRIAPIALVALLAACSGATVVQGRPAPAGTAAGTSATSHAAGGSATSRPAPAGATVAIALPRAAVFDAIGAGTSTPPTTTRGPALVTPAGLPRVLSVEAEYCPYCASERWAIAVALLRFGRLGPVGAIRSSPSDVDPDTATITFHGASFTSRTIAFTGVELYGTQPVRDGYKPLDRLTPGDQRVFDRLDPEKAIPLLDIAGRYVYDGSSFDTGVLRGRTQAQIVSALSDARSPIARAVDGAADVITAAICSATSESPARVCRSRGVVAARSTLPPR